MDSKQMEWEYKMDAMECRVQQYEEERDQILLAASSSGVRPFSLKHVRYIFTSLDESGTA